MPKFKVYMMTLVLTLMLAIAGTTYAQETGGSNGGGGADIILFDLVNTAIHAEQGGTGSTYTVWRGSDPFDGTASDNMASEEADGATEGREVFDRPKPYVYVSSGS
jgi:hypothetical protein